MAAVLGGKQRPHPRFGTVTVTLDGRSFDLAGARRERYSAPGQLPEVVPASIVADLERRDFTVNAIATAFNHPNPGTLIGVAEAMNDLAAGRLRILHHASFVDDPTRLLRMARYQARLGFELEPETAALAAAARDGGALGTVSGPRIGAELRLLARERDPVAALAALHELGLDEAIWPGFGLRAAEPGRAAGALLPPDARADLLVLGLALTGVRATDRRALLERLAFRASESAVILEVAAAERVTGALARAQRPSEIAAAASGAAPEAVAAAGAQGGGAAAASAKRWLEELRHVGLEINGEDLAAAGIEPGPAVGAGLRAALAAKLDGRAVGRQAELRLALEGASGSAPTIGPSG